MEYKPPLPTFAQSNYATPTNFSDNSSASPSYSHITSPQQTEFVPPPSFGPYPAPSYQPVLPQQPTFNPHHRYDSTPTQQTFSPFNPFSLWSSLSRASSSDSTPFQSHGTFDEEPPLLEELGINFDYIKRKTFAVLNPFQRKIDTELLNDSDLSGPFCFALLLGMILLLSGKWTFDYIYGFGAVGCISMYALVNLMAVYNVDIYKTISILGYCLLPMTILAGLSVVHSLEGIIGAVSAIACVSWCSYSAALLFTEQHDPEQRLLVFYPLTLYYTCFALLTIF